MRIEKLLLAWFLQSNFEIGGSRTDKKPLEDRLAPRLPHVLRNAHKMAFR
jgi:hypothetical protein